MDEDLRIIERVKKGDKTAFELLIQKYQRPVLNIAYRFTGCAFSAEDLAQESFLRAYRGLNGFQQKAKFFTWLYRITVNLCLRDRQRRGRFEFQSLDQKTEGDRPVQEAGDTNLQNPVEDSIELDELQKTVRNAIMNLPEDQRMAVILNRYNGLTYEEMAEVMEISVPAVKSRLHRAKMALKESLKDSLNR